MTDLSMKKVNNYILVNIKLVWYLTQLIFWYRIIFVKTWSVRRNRGVGGSIGTSTKTFLKKFKNFTLGKLRRTFFEFTYSNFCPKRFSENIKKEWPFSCNCHLIFTFMWTVEQWFFHIFHPLSWPVNSTDLR